MSHRFFQRLLATLFLIAASALSTGASAQFGLKNAAAATSSVFSTPRVRAELVAHAPQGVAPGQPLWLGLQITHQPGWHTYWKNPGDSGLPTELTWTLPEGADVGDIAWPVPQKIRVDNMANYGYDGTVLLPVVLQLAPNFKAPLLAGAAETLTVRLHATGWPASSNASPKKATSRCNCRCAARLLRTPALLPPRRRRSRSPSVATAARVSMRAARNCTSACPVCQLRHAASSCNCFLRHRPPSSTPPNRAAAGRRHGKATCGRPPCRCRPSAVRA